MSKTRDGRLRSGDRRTSCYRCGGLGTQIKELQVHAMQSACPAIWTQWSQASSTSSLSECIVQLPEAPPQEPTRDSQVFELKSGGTIKVIHASACGIPKSKDKLPLVTGKVGGKSAVVLRDTGCTRVIVKRDLVSQDQLCTDMQWCSIRL